MKVINLKDKGIIENIVTALKNGAVLVAPTDTVYGFICDASNNQAVENIFEIKKRDKTNTLPVFVSGKKMAESFAEISSKQEEVINKSWPGAVTFVLKAKPGLSSLVYKNNTIALRQPNYELVLDVLEQFKKPLAQTSANISGRPATTKIADVLEQFNNTDVIIIDAGNLPENKPSKIIDLTQNEEKILRN